MCFEVLLQVYFIMTGFEHTYFFIQMITFTLMLKEGKKYQSQEKNLKKKSEKNKL